ncbi:hypothetical protein DFH28DRAFT_921454 [Melampsora americana]|nr:hypothetical protein DFH28DRAFT_921454 [Melampsora americana]
MPSSTTVRRRTVDDDTINFLRILMAEFNRGRVEDAMMVYRNETLPVNLYGTLAYRVLQSATSNAHAEVSTLSFDIVGQESSQIATITFGRDHELGFSRGEEVRVHVLTQYTVSFALVARTLTLFAE